MNVKKYISAALLTVLAASCSEGLMDDINKNNGNPAAETVDAKFEFPGIIMNTAFSTISGDYAFYLSTYNEQEFGLGNNQMMKAELRNASETAAATTFDNVWNNTYSTLFACKQAIEKCGEGGVNAGQKDILGVAQVLTALNIGILTDMHGDVPYSEALQGDANLTPKIDSQESIYTAIFSLLDTAVANLTEAIDNDDDNLGTQDMLFQGDCNKWIGLAYALKARYTLHLQLRDQTAITKALEYAKLAIENGFEGAELDVFDSNNYNPWTAYFYDRQYTASSTTVANLMEERNDPRIDLYLCPTYGPTDAATPGDQNAAVTTGGDFATPSWLNNETASIHVFSASEIYFIIAECQARLGQDASEAFASGVTASFIDYANADGGVIGFDAGTAADYIASLPVTLKEIMVQKYLAQTRDEQVETFNDLRRAKANGEEFVHMTNPKNTQSTGNALPLRLPYAESDVRSNPNVRSAFGSGNNAGMYIFTENVWWAGGTR